MHVRGKLGGCPRDAELRTLALEEYQRRDGNYTLCRRRGWCRGGRLDRSQLGLSGGVIFTSRAAAPCALLLLLLPAARSDGRSREEGVGELELCRIGRLEYHNVLQT